ncbi:PREDICTED: vitamin K epoxide reductase complex subunit 1 isoform X1 [Trachymyrmex septentrionalis]|uniref:vitamin K epoxide reductase complex subunit 1 isoform X1 n=1 Tax=Trachymyrmex septentrionalis TaxID=34720 RepID=UPI00084F51AE|nr:PREDICTED: vitamin K epoxide reductase complex subunit 1 isoform X1 [Trachymyrmex septentrionalis]
MTGVENCAFQKFNAGIVFTCVLGLVLSYYAYTVEVKKDQDDSYQPMCDISEHISCTKVFMTEYGKGFGLFPKDSVFNIRNPIYGLIFYTLIAILSMYSIIVAYVSIHMSYITITKLFFSDMINNYTFSVAIVILGIMSNILSIYLSYILCFYRDICVVCISMYIINAVITFFAIKKFRKFQKLDSDDTHKKVK